MRDLTLIQVWADDDLPCLHVTSVLHDKDGDVLDDAIDDEMIWGVTIGDALRLLQEWADGRGRWSVPLT